MARFDLSAAAAQLAALSPEQCAAVINQMGSGFDSLVRLTYVRASTSEVVAELTAGPEHTQPYGLVHGGVYCAMAESVCSVGAVLTVLPSGRHAVGSENRTRFERPTRRGTTLTVRAVPGPTDDGWHTWHADITGDDGLLRAQSTVIVRALEPGQELAGEVVDVEDPPA